MTERAIVRLSENERMQVEIRPCDHRINRKVISKVSSPYLKTRMLLFSYEEKYDQSSSQSLAKDYARCKESWIHVVEMPLTPFREVVMYNQTDRLRIDVSSTTKTWYGRKVKIRKKELVWQGVNYLVTATYNTVYGKTINGLYIDQSLHEIDRLLDVLHANSTYDVIPFVRYKSSVMELGRQRFPSHFGLAWDDLLLTMGFTISVVRRFDRFSAFYGSALLLKASKFPELALFMKRALGVIETTPRIQAELQLPHVSELVDFVLESLPSFYFYSVGANVCRNSVDCPVNNL